MDQTKLASIKAALEKERVHAEQQLAEHGAPVGDDGVTMSVDEGFADSAQATAGRSEMLSLVQQLRDHHRDVAAALERLADGTYGKCENCGKDIPIERLEAIPTATLCLECKQASG